MISQETVTTSDLALNIPAAQGAHSLENDEDDKKKKRPEDITAWEGIKESSKDKLKRSIGMILREELLGFKLVPTSELESYGAGQESVLFHKQVMIQCDGKLDVKHIAYGYLVPKDKSYNPAYAVILKRTDWTEIVRTFSSADEAQSLASDLSDKSSISISELEALGFMIYLK